MKRRKRRFRKVPRSDFLIKKNKKILGSIRGIGRIAGPDSDFGATVWTKGQKIAEISDKTRKGIIGFAEEILGGKARIIDWGTGT